MSDSHRSHGRFPHDQLAEAASILMTMVERVIHDGAGSGCPGCAGRGSTHEGEEALAA